MLDPEWDPYTLLHEVAHEVARLNDRQLKLERFFQELANQHAAMAEHIGGQSREITDIYKEIGRILDETKQATSNNR